MDKHYLSLFSSDAVERLVLNHKQQLPRKGTRQEIDYMPVVKLHIPFTYCFWLPTELDIEDGMAFGLCQIQVAELGSVWLPELVDIDVKGLRVACDRHFRPTTTISGYARMARENGGLLTL